MLNINNTTQQIKKIYQANELACLHNLGVTNSVANKFFLLRYIDEMHSI